MGSLNKHSSCVEDYSFRTPVSGNENNFDGYDKDQNDNVFRFSKANMIPLESKKNESSGHKAKSLLFSNSEEMNKNDEYLEVPEDPFSPLKDPASKNSSEKRDIWTNAIITELEMDAQSDNSSFTMRNTFVNISVSRNHLKLNILLRVLMIIVYV